MKHSTKETRQQFVCVCVRVCVWGGGVGQNLEKVGGKQYWWVGSS